jgi:hypothetical protein
MLLTLERDGHHDEEVALETTHHKSLSLGPFVQRALVSGARSVGSDRSQIEK